MKTCKVSALTCFTMVICCCMISCSDPVTPDEIDPEVTQGITEFHAVLEGPINGTTDLYRVTYRYKPMIDGIGIIALTGRGGGNQIGDVVSPVTGALGVVEVKHEYEAFVDRIDVWEFLITVDPGYWALTVEARYDSVVVDGVMRSRYSSEVYEEYGVYFSFMSMRFLNPM